MRKTILTTVAGVLLLTACRRSGTTEPDGVAPLSRGPFWTSLPRLIQYDDSLRHNYYRVSADPASGVLTLSSDTVGNTSYYRYYYGSAGELLRIDVQQPGNVRSVTLQRTVGRIVVSGYKPAADTIDINTTPTGLQGKIQAASWSNTTPLHVISRYRGDVQLDAGYRPLLGTFGTDYYPPSSSNNSSRVTFRYGANGLESLVQQIGSGFSGSSDSFWLQRDAHADTLLARFVAGIYGNDLSWIRSDRQVLPACPLFLQLVWQPVTDRQYFEGGLPVRVDRVSRSYGSPFTSRATERNSGTYDSQGRLVRLEHSVDGWNVPPSVLRIVY